MRRSKTTGFDSKKFLAAFEEMGAEKGLTNETIAKILEDSFRATITRKLEDEDRVFANVKNRNAQKVKLSDALVRVDINMEKGTLDIFHQFKVVHDDDIEDDFIEIGLSDPRLKGGNYKINDYYEERISIDTDFNQGDVNRFKSNFTQRLAKAEKDALLEIYKDKIGQLVNGTVEKSDSHSVVVNLGRTSSVLYPQNLIGHETFKAGDNIKVYIEGIGKDKDDRKGANLIRITRSSSEFLRKLFEMEVHEIYDGTVVIKDIARRAGQKSKVSVYTDEPNIDPSGACIGPNGSRIQAIVSQLGNARDSKEKIDVIAYHNNLGLYLEECLKPGVMIGANIDYDARKATVITQDGTGSLAIGNKGINLYLTRVLTKLEAIEILDYSEALEKGIEFKTIEEFTTEAREEEKKRVREEALKRQKALETKVTPVVEEVKENYTDKDEYDDEDLEEEIIDSIEVSAEPVEETVVEEAPTEPVKETVKEVKEEKVEEVPSEPVRVKTTTTLESLEKSLEEEKEKEKARQAAKSKKKKKVTKEEEKEDEVKKEVKKMAIYTDEELAEIDDEFDDIDEEEDYSEYDSDSYYDE